MLSAAALAARGSSHLAPARALRRRVARALTANCALSATFDTTPRNELRQGPFSARLAVGRNKPIAAAARSVTLKPIQPIDLRQIMVFCRIMPRPARARLGEQSGPRLPTELVAAARLGDSRAAEVLWERCVIVARQVARRWAGSGLEADDLSQEALLRAVESFSSLRDPAALVNWLQMVVRRSANHDARRGRRKRPLWSGGSDPEVLPSLEALPDFHVDVRLLLTLLDGLSEEERNCLWLRRAEGWRIEEIASETGLSVSTIRRRVRTAEHSLMKRLRG